MHEYVNNLKCDAYFSLIALIPLAIISLFALVVFGVPNSKSVDRVSVNENINLND